MAWQFFQQNKDELRRRYDGGFLIARLVKVWLESMTISIKLTILCLSICARITLLKKKLWKSKPSSLRITSREPNEQYSRRWKRFG